MKKQVTTNTAETDIYITLTLQERRPQYSLDTERKEESHKHRSVILYQVMINSVFKGHLFCC